jgi:uncharacterized damage-inducible protein DinB
MIEMLRDLVAHKGHANAAMLRAIQSNADAASDAEIGELLHHILVANRFWMFSILGLPFMHDIELRAPESFDALVNTYRDTHEQESRWLSAATDVDLARVLEGPLIPGGSCSVSQAVVQVCMHSQGHRAQCAKLLRRHGSKPPMTDFILWVTSRPGATWDVARPG